jgi:hypothetical protein
MNETFAPNGGTGYFPLDTDYMAVNPIANTPAETYALDSKQIEFDVLGAGFSLGVGGQAAQIQNLNFKHIGKSDVGGLSFINTNSDIGNGVDAIDIGGLGHIFGFSNIDANVTMSGPLQGYGYQVNMEVGSVMNSYLNAFYDFCDIDTACGSYQSFACGPTILSIKNNSNYAAFNCNTNIPTFTGNSGFTGIALSPTLGTFGTGSFQGIVLNPTVSSVVNANGIFVDMSNVTASGTKYAGYFDGDVNITGSLTFGGALSIGKLSAYASQAVIDGGGNPFTIHGLVTNPTIAANATTANADTIGVNTAMLLSIGDNSTTTSGAFGLGMATLAFPAVITTGTGSTLDYLAGAVFALSFDGASTGGTIAQAYGARAVYIPNGITTVTRAYGFFAHQPFGLTGVDNWGVYSEDFEKNYFEGAVVVGVSDVQTNTSCGIELNSTVQAVVLSRMTETERNALTAVAGMMIYNTDANVFQGYNGSLWKDFH